MAIAGYDRPHGPGGALAGSFTHVVFKGLTAVEADATRSNQHEFNASGALREMFGLEQPQRMETDFVWMPDDGAFVTEKGVLTWYDARARHPTRSEFRLYYRDNAVVARASAGDMLLIGKRPNGRILLLLAPGSGVAAERIAWLFGIEVLPGSGFAALSIEPGTDRALAVELASGAFAPPSGDGWESEEAMAAASDDGAVRDGVRADQAGVSQVGRSYELEWLASSDETLVQTVHGVLRPWEQPDKPSPKIKDR